MKKRKPLIISIIVLALCALSSIAFYFSRPLVVFFTGDADSFYVENLDKPKPLTASYRTKIVGNPEENVLNEADFIINHSVIGLNYENVYDMSYDLKSLVEPYLAELGDEVTYIYDSTDSCEVELCSFLEKAIPDLNEISYDGQISRADYGVYRSRVGDGLIITTSLSETIDFIRAMENAEIAVTYLDAAALEILEPAVIFSPDWDGIIKENL